MNRITYVGHATVLLEVDGVRLLTDPLLERRATHLWRTVPLPTINPEAVDAVLLSHLHGDHLHLPSLRRVGKDVRIIAPEGSIPFLGRHGFHNVVELKPGAETDVNGLRIEATMAAHDGPPLPWRPATDALGYITHNSRAIYFAGDTDIFPEMEAIGQVIDIALLPVWGYGPTLGPGHLDPLRAAVSLRMLQPSVAIPIHWGTYAPAGFSPMMTRLLRTPPRRFAYYARSIAPDVRTVILPPGRHLDLPADVPVTESAMHARQMPIIR